MRQQSQAEEFLEDSAIGSERLVDINPIIFTFRYRVLKRLLDITLAGLALIILSPLYVLISILIRLTSKGPVLHRYEMVGLGGRVFRGQKFRSMVVNAHEMRKHIEDQNEMEGPVFKIKDDPRVTTLGRWLRRYSLDEIPQLWSVILGDLSLVGPRPPGPYEADKFESWHWEKLSVKPGMTSLWIVRGKSRTFDEWVRIDLEYIKNWSVTLDLLILIRTVPVVMLGRNY